MMTTERSARARTMSSAAVEGARDNFTNGVTRRIRTTVALCACGGVGDDIDDDKYSAHVAGGRATAFRVARVWVVLWGVGRDMGGFGVWFGVGENVCVCVCALARLTTIKAIRRLRCLFV